MAQEFTTTTTVTTVTMIPATGSVRLFHGTDLESANWIARYGLSQERSLELGGGSFWTTPDVTLANTFAGLNPAGGPPALLGFDLYVDVVHSFLRKSPAWVLEQSGVGLEFFSQCYTTMKTAMRNVTTTEITMTIKQ